MWKYLAVNDPPTNGRLRLQCALVRVVSLHIAFLLQSPFINYFVGFIILFIRNGVASRTALFSLGCG